MQQEVYMDFDEVQKLSNQFGTFGETLQSVSKVLEMTITVLRATAFVGLVGGAALARYLDIIKPRIDKAALKMFELKDDVQGAINHIKNGDESGSRRFR